jgi:hypothetical protein
VTFSVAAGEMALELASLSDVEAEVIGGVNDVGGKHPVNSSSQTFSVS